MLSLLAAPPAVEVHQLDGSTVKGELVELGEGLLVLKTEQRQPISISTQQIISVIPAEEVPPADSPGSEELCLADGSQLLVSNFGISSREADFSLPSDKTAHIGKSAVKGLRFVRPSDSPDAKQKSDLLEQAWQKMVEGHQGGDAIVLNRDGSLTMQEVIIHGISKEGVKIQLDDITTTVNPSKLYGLLFYQRGSREFPSPLCVVYLDDGSKLEARMLRIANGQTQVITLTGTELPIPFSRIKKLDFAAGNIQFLDDLKPSQVNWTPILKSGIAVDAFRVVYAPKMNVSFDGEPLQLEEDGQPQTYARGMAVHATSSILYDLPAGFRQLQMRAGIAPQDMGSCTARLRIAGDQKILFEKEFTGDMPPVDIALDITGVRRLKILVDALDNEDLSDVLHLVQARLIK